MKICILSMQRVNNLGSLLQAYSLKKILEEMGHTVFFIDIEKDKNNIIKITKNDFKEEREESEGLFSKIKKIDKYALNRINIKRKAEVQDEKFEEFRRNVLNIVGDENNKKYDLCIIGSDEVFNCLTDSKWGFTTQLFGNVKQANKVITYAASCGATKYELLPLEIKDKIRQVFSEHISAFSVRDENTKKFVENLSDKNVTINLDPVVVGNFQHELERINNLDKKLPKRYCIVYSYYNRIHNRDEINAIKKFCKEGKMDIVAVGAPQMWIKKYLVLEPFEMLKVFQNAEFVITDTFHGTIFASKYSKRFSTIIRESNKNKLSDLLIRLNKSQHKVEKISDIYKIYNIQNDIAETNNIEKKEFLRTKQYLNDNIN